MISVSRMTAVGDHGDRGAKAWGQRRRLVQFVIRERAYGRGGFATVSAQESSVSFVTSVCSRRS